MTAPSILVVHADHKTRRLVVRILGGLGYRVDAAGDVERAAERIARDPPALVVAAADGVDALGPLLAASRASGVETRTLLLDATARPPPRSPDVDAVTNLLVHPMPVLGEALAITAQKLIRRDLFGAEKYLLWGTELEHTLLTRASQRSHIVGELADQVRARGQAARVASRAMLVTDELLSNAVHHAPVDAGGAHYRAELPRDADLALDARHEVQLRWGCDGRYLAVEVTDRFGSLDRDTLLAALVHQDVKDAGCGAGMGIALTYRSCDHLVFNLAPGTRTEAIALIDVRHSQAVAQAHAQALALAHAQGERPTASSYNVFVERPHEH